MTRRPLISDARSAKAFRDEYEAAQHGQRFHKLLNWAQSDTLRDDYDDIAEMLDNGKNVQAIDHVAQILGMDATELLGVLGPEGQNRAGLLGYVRGLVDGAEPVDRKAYGKQRMDIDDDTGRPRRRRLYG